MEELLKQLLTGQNKIVDRLDKMDERFDKIEARLERVEGQLDENTQLIRGLMHNVETRSRSGWSEGDDTDEGVYCASSDKRGYCCYCECTANAYGMASQIGC